MTKKPIRYAFRSVSEMEAAAKSNLPDTVFAYLNGAAEDGYTDERNKSAFNQWSLIPRRLLGIQYPSTAVEVLGQSFDIPFGAAPVGMQQLFHVEGERATTLACAHFAAPCALSTVSNLSYAEATKEATVKPWFQLYPTDNLNITKQLIKNAEAAGANTIVLTVDVPVLGKRRHNARALLQTPDFSHLQFGNLEGILSNTDAIHDSSMNWDKLAYIRSLTKAKLIVKGILHPEDAKQCIALGIDGIIISNHGGRQMESNYSTLEALAAMKPVLPSDFPLFLDGGVRSATDILKAIMLGAKLVFLGRPICYGLAIGGRDGVQHLFQMLRNDLLRNMQLMGIADIGTITSSQIVRNR